MVGCMADDVFEHPRLVAIYDALDPDRSDLDVYAAIAHALDARSVLDVGCGTGTFALLLADRGIEVTGVDPAGGSLDAARAKPGSKRVHWIHGDATVLPPMQVDLVTMTANVAQAIVDPQDWEGRSAACVKRCAQVDISSSRPGTRHTARGWGGIARSPPTPPRSRVSARSRAGLTWLR